MRIYLEYAFADSQLERHSQNPGEKHCKDMDIFVGYIKGKKI